MTRLTSGWRQLRTAVEIAVWRFGWVWGVVLTAGLAVLLCQYAWLPQQQKLHDVARHRLAGLQAEQARKLNLPAAATSVDDGGFMLAALTRISFAESEVSGVMRQINQMASAGGLSLAQSEFQTSGDGHGGLRQVQVTLPMRATYPQLRQWIESVLRQLPGVSIDQLAIKRETVAQGQADIRVKLSIWVDPLKAKPTSGPTAPVAAQAGGRS